MATRQLREKVMDCGQSTTHRLSCHRCGNIRKTEVHMCVKCPHIFCPSCKDKMIHMNGIQVFLDGCPVCKHLCCCGNKTKFCTRQYHCYKKCPSTKTSHSKTIESSDNTTTSVTESSASLSQLNKTDPPSTFTLNDEPAAKRKRFIAPKPDQSTVEAIDKPTVSFASQKYTQVNNVFFLQSEIPVTDMLPTIQPLLLIPQHTCVLGTSTAKVYDIVDYPTLNTPASNTKTSENTNVSTASDFAILNDNLYLSPDAKSTINNEGDRLSATLTRSLLGYGSDDEGGGVSSIDVSIDLNKLFETNTATMKGLYTGEFSTPSRETQATTEEADDSFSFHGSEVNATPVCSMFQSPNCTVRPSPQASLRELTSLFAKETPATPFL